MILVVMGFPYAAISLGIVEGEDSTTSVAQETVWYDDFIPTVRTYVEEYDVEKAVMFGPTDYVEGLAKMINEFVDNIEIVVGD